MGSQMKYFRMLKGISQEELGKAAGITKHAIRHIENGELRLVNLSLVDKLVAYLGIEEQVEYDDYIRFIKKNPAAKLKAYRKQEHLTMYELAKRMNVAYSTVKKWESSQSVMSRSSYQKFVELVNADSL